MSPFKSEAQRRKFAEMLNEGKISQDTFNEWNTATGKKKLPERVKKVASSPKPTKVGFVKTVKSVKVVK